MHASAPAGGSSPRAQAAVIHCWQLLWCLALSCAACAEANPQSDAAQNLDMDAKQVDRGVDASLCRSPCPPCAQDERCIGDDVYIDYLVPTCLRICAVTPDCPEGMRCAL